MLRFSLMDLHLSDVKWYRYIVIGFLGLTLASQAQASRLDLDITLSGTWEDTEYYEAESRNYGFPNSFHETDEGSDQAVVDVLGVRTRPVVEPWTLPGDPVMFTGTVPIGRSVAAFHHLEIKNDAIDDQDIEGYARILHLTPTTDQTIDISVLYIMRSEGGVYLADLSMIDESATEPSNLLPHQTQRYTVNLAQGAVTGTDIYQVQVQAGKSYTFEVEYDIYPAFVPEPTTLALVGLGGLIVFRRQYC